MNSQNIPVFNPFKHDLIPSEFDSFGGEYQDQKTKIWCVVSGTSQGGWSGHKLYTQQIIDVKSWKLKEDANPRRSDLIIFRCVEKSYDLFSDIPKFAIVELDIFINKKMNRAVMVSGKIILNPTPEMMDEQVYVKIKKSITIDGFEGFVFNHESQNFLKKVKWMNKEITILIDIDNESKLTDELQTLNELFDNQKKYNQIVIDFGINHILALKNESWLSPEEKPMTKAQFIENSSLESIRIYRDGGFEFGFDETKNIFNGGYFVINGTTEKGAISYDIGF